MTKNRELDIKNRIRHFYVKSQILDAMQTTIFYETLNKIGSMMLVYGKLYNWYAVAGIHDNDPTTPDKTLAPSGWRIPSNNDWTELTDFLGAREVAGSNMKATGTSLWVAPNIATNESGFTALPAGERRGGFDFEGVGIRSGWWSSNEISLDQAKGRSILNYSPFSFIYNAYKNMGLSVRCVYGETLQ